MPTAPHHPPGDVQRTLTPFEAFGATGLPYAVHGGDGSWIDRPLGDPARAGDVFEGHDGWYPLTADAETYATSSRCLPAELSLACPWPRPES